MCVPVLPHYIEITIAVHIRHGTGIDTFAGDDWLGTLKYPLIIKVDTDLLCVPGYGGKYIQISVSVKIDPADPTSVLFTVAEFPLDYPVIDASGNGFLCEWNQSVIISPCMKRVRDTTCKHAAAGSNAKTHLPQRLSNRMQRQSPRTLNNSILAYCHGESTGLGVEI